MSDWDPKAFQALLKTARAERDAAETLHKAAQLNVGRLEAECRHRDAAGVSSWEKSGPNNFRCSICSVLKPR